MLWYCHARNTLCAKFELNTTRTGNNNSRPKYFLKIVRKWIEFGFLIQLVHLVRLSYRSQSLFFMLPSQIPIVVLCGGESLRFRTRSADYSKALAPIGDVPIVCHIINRFRKIGCSHFIVCVRDSDVEISSFFKESSAFSYGLSVVKTGEYTPTGGRLKAIEDLIKTDQFVVTYGDCLSDVSIESVYNQHQEKKATATVMAAKPRSSYGILEVDENDAVTKFNEKPLLDYWVNAGLFIFNRQIFSYLNNESVLETDCLVKLVDNNQLMVYKHSGFWQAMDTPKEHELLVSMWASNNAFWT